MNQAEKLEQQVQHLPPEDLAKFRAWFYEFDAQVWDRKIESDTQLGKLSTLLAEARREFESDRAARSESLRSDPPPGATPRSS
jgi:hypothetical protein